MGLIFSAVYRAVNSLRSAALLKWLIVSILLNALILVSLITGVYLLLASVNWFGTWDWLADAGLTMLAAVIGYFLYPLLLPLIISFFDTIIADTIEREEYPNLRKQEPPFWPTFMQDVRFTLKVLLINLLMLPVYFLPGINVLLYFIINGYLIGIEFFHVVAGRHITVEESERLKRKHRLTLSVAGMLIVCGSTVPFLNLVAPMCGVAVMVHFFHGLRPAYGAETQNRD